MSTATPAPAVNLTAASHQWATRPDDERFSSLSEMLKQTRHYKDMSRETETNTRQLQVMGDDSLGEIITTCGQAKVLFSHYGFGRFCGLIGAPANYLRSLPASMAGSLLQHGLISSPTQNLNLLIQANGFQRIRAATSAKYERIWNADVVEQLNQLQQDRPSWQVPPARPARANQKGARPATEQDCLRLRMPGLGIQPGDMIAPAGLYASDHDMFAFLVNESRLIDGGGQGNEPMARGFYVSNSEVGERTFTLTMFLYSFVCGNHIIWGAKHVREIRIRHIGTRARDYHQELWRMIHDYTNEAASKDERLIRAARTFKLIDAPIGAMSTKQLQEKVCDRVYKLQTGITKAQTERAWELGGKFAREHGEPDTAWGFVGGLTRLSQQTTYADERERMDRAAGRILDLVPVG